MLRYSSLRIQLQPCRVLQKIKVVVLSVACCCPLCQKPSFYFERDVCFFGRLKISYLSTNWTSYRNTIWLVGLKDFDVYFQSFILSIIPPFLRFYYCRVKPKWKIGGNIMQHISPVFGLRQTFVVIANNSETKYDPL